MTDGVARLTATIPTARSAALCGTGGSTAQSAFSGVDSRLEHRLMPPCPLTNAASDFGGVLWSPAYRSSLDHLDRVRPSTFAGSAVQKIMMAVGSSAILIGSFANRRARRAREFALFSRLQVAANA